MNNALRTIILLSKKEEPKPKVMDLSLLEKGHDSAKVSFSDIGADSYKLYIDNVFSKNINWNANGISITGLQSETSYEVYVTSMFDGEEGGPGNILSFVTDQETIAAVTDLEVVSVSTDQITIDFTDITGATSYDLYIDNVFHLNFSYSPSGYTITGLAQGTTYSLKLKTKKNAISSGFSNVATATTDVAVLEVVPQYSRKYDQNNVLTDYINFNFTQTGDKAICAFKVALVSLEYNNYVLGSGISSAFYTEGFNRIIKGKISFSSGSYSWGGSSNIGVPTDGELSVLMAVQNYNNKTSVRIVMNGVIYPLEQYYTSKPIDFNLTFSSFLSNIDANVDFFWLKDTWNGSINIDTDVMAYYDLLFDSDGNHTPQPNGNFDGDNALAYLVGDSNKWNSGVDVIGRPFTVQGQFSPAIYIPPFVVPQLVELIDTTTSQFTDIIDFNFTGSSLDIVMAIHFKIDHSMGIPSQTIIGTESSPILNISGGELYIALEPSSGSKWVYSGMGSQDGITIAEPANTEIKLMLFLRNEGLGSKCRVIINGSTKAISSKSIPGIDMQKTFGKLFASFMGTVKMFYVNTQWSGDINSPSSVKQYYDKVFDFDANPIVKENGNYDGTDAFAYIVGNHKKWNKGIDLVGNTFTVTGEFIDAP